MQLVAIGGKMQDIIPFFFFLLQQSFDFFAGLINYTDGIKPSGKGPLHWQEEKKEKKKKREKVAVIRHLYLMTEISPHVDEAHQHLDNIFVPHH